MSISASGLDCDQADDETGDDLISDGMIISR